MRKLSQEVLTIAGADDRTVELKDAAEAGTDGAMIEEVRRIV